MDKKSFDPFKLCWDVVFQESAKCEKKLFNSEYCKIIDSRDINFEIVENRLAYTYKFGYFNISFFEKCFSLFINQCSGALFPFESLKACSLSNGPGFDVIGLLSAVCISNKPLKCLPVLNSINVHESWSELYKTLVSKAYEICIAKSFTELIHVSQSINLIKGDIYSTLSSEAKNIISDSNVLLMVNAFVSSKATPTTFENSLKEIFMLLQPGSLIFFIGSKNNFKLFSKLTDMKQYVKCVYGPQKVTLDNLPIDEHLSNVIGVKPYSSGHAQFVVWQKKNKCLDSAGDEQDDSDTMSDLCPSSESSFASFVENGDKSKFDLESSDNFYSSLEEKIKSKFSENKPHSLSLEVNSVENITSALSNIKLNHVNCEEQKLQASQQDIFQPSGNNASNLVLEPSHSFIENKLSVVRDNIVVEETVKNNGISLKNAELVSTDNKVSPANLINEEAIIQSTPTKKSKRKKVQSVNKTEDQSLNENIKKDNCEHSKTLQSSCKNLVKFEKEVITPQATNVEALNYTDNSVQSLLQQCGSLISKLEELTDDIKNGFNSSGKGQIFNKTHFCSRQTENCHVFHHNCCVKIVHSCCCKKICKH